MIPKIRAVQIGADSLCKMALKYSMTASYDPNDGEFAITENIIGDITVQQLKALSEELHAACGDNEEAFMEKYREAKQKPYDFLMLDFRKLKAYRNLTDLLYEKNVDK